MPEFILLCQDKKDSLELRKATRAAHLDYVGTATDPVLLAGPMLDDDGNPEGSLLIITASDKEAAQRFAANDPYARAGLFERVEIRPYLIVRAKIADKSP